MPGDVGEDSRQATSDRPPLSTAAVAQLGLFGASPPAPSNPRTKCRRAGCGQTLARHPWEGCGGFIGPEDVAKPPKKAPSTSERLYREAYEAGIREASPLPFTVAGQKVGSVLGPALAQHAPGVAGAELLAWLRAKSRAFRKATDARPEFWGGWQPHFFVRWLNMGERAEDARGERANMLQKMPVGGFKIRSVSLAEVK